MTRRDREIALALATAYSLFDAAHLQADAGSREERELLREIGHVFEDALGSMAERLNVDAEDLIVAVEEYPAIYAEINKAARAWVLADAEAERWEASL